MFKRIGVFDSGAGGISVLKSLIHSKRFKEIIYYGDTARVPYGIKNKETIIQYSLEALNFFKNFDLDLLVIACNTVSAYALDSMRKIAPYEIIGVIKPGVLALQNKIKDKDSNILVLGTKATINSNLYQNLLEQKGYKNVIGLATGLFVPIVEEGILKGKVLDSTMDYYFSKITTKPNGIILGCTHFPLIAKEISSYFNNQSTLIHSGEAIMEYIHNHYKLNSTFLDTKIQFFASDGKENLESIAKIWLS